MFDFVFSEFATIPLHLFTVNIPSLGVPDGLNRISDGKTVAITTPSPPRFVEPPEDVVVFLLSPMTLF